MSPADADGSADGAGTTDDGDPATAAETDRSPEDVVVERVLVPVDGSDEALAAVEHAAAVAERYGAGVHALYVLGDETARGIRNGDLQGEAVAEGSSRFVERVNAVCERQSVAVSCSTATGFSTGRLTRHPGSVILDCADEVDADFLVVPRERAVDAPEVLEKAAEYVLSYASQPVLAV